MNEEIIFKTIIDVGEPLSEGWKRIQQSFLSWKGQSSKRKDMVLSEDFRCFSIAQSEVCYEGDVAMLLLVYKYKPEYRGRFLTP